MPVAVLVDVPVEVEVEVPALLLLLLLLLLLFVLDTTVDVVVDPRTSPHGLKKKNLDCGARVRPAAVVVWFSLDLRECLGF